MVGTMRPSWFVKRHVSLAIPFAHRQISEMILHHTSEGQRQASEAAMEQWQQLVIQSGWDGT